MVVRAGAREGAKLAGNLSPKLPWSLANPLWASVLNPALTALSDLLLQPLLNNYQIIPVTLVANTAKSIPHTLGAVPSGWFLVDNNANAVVWRTAWTQQTITIEASANATVSIYVF